MLQALIEQLVHQFHGRDDGGVVAERPCALHLLTRMEDAAIEDHLESIHGVDAPFLSVGKRRSARRPASPVVLLWTKCGIPSRRALNLARMRSIALRVRRPARPAPGRLP